MFELVVPNTTPYYNHMEPLLPIDPEFETMLATICQHNAKVPKKNRLMVDFDTGQIGFAVARATPTIERNACCPCGSGKKYKKCCMR